MPVDPRVTALTSTMKAGLNRKREAKAKAAGLQQGSTLAAKRGRQVIQGSRRPGLSTNALITPSQQPNAPRPPGQPGLIGDTQETKATSSPTSSAPALGMLTEQLVGGVARKRKKDLR